MKEIILDTETTGLSAKDGHRLVEIGCIELENLIPTKNKFHCYLNPERKVSEKAFEVHGYTDEFLSSKKKFKEVVQEFLNFISGKRLIIHNAEFDLSHLNNELKIIGEETLKKRKNFNQKLLKKFKEIQLPTSYKKKKSKFIIKNNFTKKSVREGIKNILKEIV